MSKTYEQAHQSIRAQRGSASGYLCECGRPARDWAFLHKAAPLYSPQGRPYSEDPADYAPMCRSCHQSYDFQNQENVRDVRTRAGRAAGRANAARWAADPEKKAQSAGGRANAEKLRSDPEYAARTRRENARGGRMGGATGRRECLDCGKVSHPAGIGSHQKHSGHTGYKDLEN